MPDFDRRISLLQKPARLRVIKPQFDQKPDRLLDSAKP
jgi:hypothetical protein